MPKDLNIENPLDSHLKPVKDSDGTDSALEISTEDVRVKNLTVSGTTTGISASDDTKLPLAGGTMTGDIAMSDAGITNVKELTLAAGEDGLSLDGGSNYIQAFKDEDNMASNSDTAICSQQSIKAYADTMLPLTGGQLTGAVGFDRILAADATNVEIDFTAGNKAHLDMTGGSISGTLTLKFPATSGNFVLVVQQDSSTRTIAAYATKDAAGNAGNNDGGTSGAIRWAGGSVPDLTDGGNKRDILSFYWDSDEEVCYGVASLNF